LHKTTEKVQAVVDAPRPTNTQQLRSFLGLVNYYHKFLPNLATILHPLNRLLEQGRKSGQKSVAVQGVDHIRHGSYTL
jgi:hypothetical protein